MIMFSVSHCSPQAIFILINTPSVELFFTYLTTNVVHHKEHQCQRFRMIYNAKQLGYKGGVMWRMIVTHPDWFENILEGTDI